MGFNFLIIIILMFLMMNVSSFSRNHFYNSSKHTGNDIILDLWIVFACWLETVSLGPRVIDC
ncbi:hypothetical protein BY996DRAFT_7447696 [Phakopsora pachyrhizi]|nr:hypothetical protein BY996DRAFT_7447696 [Phakopsora pachyrhizi]